MSWTGIHLRTLIEEIGRLVPSYWPNECANDDYFIDFEQGCLTRTVVPEGKTVLEALMGEGEVDFSGGYPLSDEEHEEHIEDVLKFLGKTMESLANLYERHKPEAMQDPHDTSVRRKLMISGEEHSVVIFDDPKDANWITVAVEELGRQTTLALYEKDDELCVTTIGITNMATQQERETNADVASFRQLIEEEGPEIIDGAEAEEGDDDVLQFEHDETLYVVSRSRIRRIVVESSIREHMLNAGIPAGEPAEEETA